MEKIKFLFILVMENQCLICYAFCYVVPCCLYITSLLPVLHCLFSHAQYQFAADFLFFILVVKQYFSTPVALSIIFFCYCTPR